MEMEDHGQGPTLPHHTLLNLEGGHSDQRNDPSASYNAATLLFLGAIRKVYQR